MAGKRLIAWHPTHKIGRSVGHRIDGSERCCVSHPRIYMSPPHMSGRERQLVSEVFDSNWIAPVGPHLAELEKQFAARVGVTHAAAVSSGTAALHLALRRLNLTPEDHVICPTFTFCASVNPVLYERAKVVFLDVDRKSWNLDPNLLAEELKHAASRNQLPKAIIAVDILGQSVDIDAINQLASQFSVPVIEDAAEALGGTYKDQPIGSSAWVSTFSFNGNKIITTSGGGMVCSNDEALINKAKFWATQAKDPGPLYHHTELGFNYRMSNVLAAIGIGQLEVLDERIAKRKQTFNYYQAELSKLPGVQMMPIADYGEPNYWLSVAQFEPSEFGASCEDVRLALEAENIESRRVWVPLHQLPLYEGSRYRGGTVAQEVFDVSLCLPSGTALTEDDLQRVVQVIKSCQPA